MSGHVDDLLAVADIAEAVAALPAAEKGDDDAQFVVDGAEGHELLWFASQELPYLARARHPASVTTAGMSPRCAVAGRPAWAYTVRLT